MPKKTENYDKFLVQGNSMLPILKPNQIVKIVKIKDVKIGDIIVFKRNIKRKRKNFKVIHRIVKINRNKIITKGDHTSNCDIPITHKEIIGKVIKVGNKKVDAPYYNFINPFIARLSYLQAKFYFLPYIKFKIFPKYLQDLKLKLIGDKDLKIEKTILFFLNLPHKINYRIYRLLSK